MSRLPQRPEQLQTAVIALGLAVVFGAVTATVRAEGPGNNLAPGSEAVIPSTTVQVRVDGRLDEPCYQGPPLVDRFALAGQPGKRPPATRAWLFWQRDRLIFAFECEDSQIVAAPPSSREHDVDGQDRVELFLWSGRNDDTYYCAEIGAYRSLHDYSAKFYRRFDDAWSMPGLEYAVSSTPKGYRVEGSVSRSGLETMGFRLEPGARWRVGLFRADAAPGKGPADLDWITWVDAKGPRPDFHVAGSFGTCTLGPERPAVAPLRQPSAK